MILPSDLSTNPEVLEMPKTEYNFPTQKREGEIPAYAGFYTSNTLQTYDYSGKPYDARGDNFD
jgi:hypothetical protein